MRALLFVLLSACTSFAHEAEIMEVASEYGVDPQLAVAIAVVESGMNPEARGALGEVGLFQLRPEFHPVVEGDPSHNIKVAIRYLAYVKERCAPIYGDAWFICYNTGPHRKERLTRPHEFPYYKKVRRIADVRN